MIRIGFGAAAVCVAMGTGMIWWGSALAPNSAGQMVLFLSGFWGFICAGSILGNTIGCWWVTRQ